MINKGFRGLVTMALTVLICFNVKANDHDEIVYSKDIFIEVFELLAKGDTAKALAAYDKMNVNDTSYTVSLIHRMEIYEMQGDYDKIIELCDKALATPNDKEVNFLIRKGNAYLSMEKPEKAKEIYQMGVEKYPYNHIFYYNIGIAHRELGNYDKYIELIKRTINMYPFYASAHKELAYTAASEGRLSQALMSYIMALLIEPNGSSSLPILSYMNTIATSEIEEESIGYKFPEGQDDFSEIDVIISNKVALQKGYKVKSTFDISLIRQLQVLMETLEYDASDEGFWMQFYVNFYKKIWDSNRFTEFSYAIMQPSNVQAHMNVVRKKTKDIESFNTWAGQELVKYFNTVPLIIGDEVIETKRQYRGRLLSIGEIKNGVEVGCFKYFHETGALEGEGCYDSQGKTIGEWKWYNKRGELNKSFTAKNDELDGYLRGNYQIGTKFRDVEYKAGEKHGSYKEYYKLGALYAEIDYKNGKMDGHSNYYYENGQKKFDFNTKDDKIVGRLREYHPNGELKGLTKYKDGLKDSVVTYYYPNGNIESTYNYNDGELNGTFTEYFINGDIEASGKYADGNLVGKVIENFSNGEVYEITIYDEDGLKNGTYIEHDIDGVKFLELDFKKGLILAYRVFDKAGKVTQEGVKKSGDFNFLGAYPDGTRSTKGIYNSKGGKVGNWEFYDFNGNLTSKSNYVKGGINGKTTDYYGSGQTEEVTFYDEGTWNGNYKSYYQSGELWEAGNSADGDLQGAFYEYYSNGTLMEKLYFVDGDRHGWQEFYGVDGKLKRKEFYNYGELILETSVNAGGEEYETLDYRNLNGVVKTHYPNGKLKYEGQFINGTKNGSSKWYYGNGKVSVDANYIDGIRDGAWKAYYPSGKLKREYNYVLGDLHGNYITYHENGKKSDTYTYEYGDIVGDNIYYNENGTISAKYPYVMGNIEGKALFYDYNGVLNHARFYHNDKKIGYSYPGKDGALVEMIPIKNETIKVESYFANGKLGRTYEIKKGDYDGPYTRYYESGAKARVSNYKDDYNEGDVTTYYESGQIKSLRSFKADDLQGAAIKYYANGKVKSEKNYINDELHGTAKFYNESGKLMLEQEWFNGYMYSEKSY